MDLSFRDIKKSDIDTCLSIMQKNYDETNDSFYSRNLIIDLQDIFIKDDIYKSNCRICLSGDEIVGFGCYKQSKMSFDIYELFWINVKYEYQNKGIGKLIIKDIEDDIRTYETHYEHYQILFSTKKSYFYQKLGYTTIFSNESKNEIMLKSF